MTTDELAATACVLRVLISVSRASAVVISRRSSGATDASRVSLTVVTRSVRSSRTVLLYFEIVDDGVGYDVDSAPQAGQGLAKMSDRITLVVKSTPGRGTTARANIPVDDATTQRVGPVAHSGSEGRSADV